MTKKIEAMERIVVTENVFATVDGFKTEENSSFMVHRTITQTDPILFGDGFTACHLASGLGLDVIIPKEANSLSKILIFLRWLECAVDPADLVLIDQIKFGERTLDPKIYHAIYRILQVGQKYQKGNS